MRRLYNAVCGWLEASAEAIRGEEPQREGDNFTTTELGRTYSADPEMHLGYRPQSIDDDNGATVRPISLKWNPPIDGVYRVSGMRRSAITNRYITNREPDGDPDVSECVTR